MSTLNNKKIQDTYPDLLTVLGSTNGEGLTTSAKRIFDGDGTGSAETALFGMNADDVFDGKVVVDNVTIHSDGKLRFGDGDETSTTVGSSAMEVRGAFRNIGGSIDIV